MTRTLFDAATGDLLVTMGTVSFLRGDGGFGGKSEGAPKPRPCRPIARRTSRRACTPSPQPGADLSSVRRLQPAAHRSRGCAQRRVRPADSAWAVRLRHGRSGADQRCLCGDDPDRLRRLDVRFTSPVYPGEPLHVEIWKLGGGRRCVPGRCDADRRRRGRVDFGRFEVPESRRTLMFNACGVVTITTDFGHQGPFVATMKGRILSRLPDGAHHRCHARGARCTGRPKRDSGWRARMRYFPAGSVHVAVVDPGVGTNRDIIAVVADGSSLPGAGQRLAGADRGARRSRSSIYRLDLAAARSRGSSCRRPARRSMAATSSRRLPPNWPPVGPIRPIWARNRPDDIVPSWVEDPAASGRPGQRRRHHDRPLRQPDHEYRRRR